MNRKYVLIGVEGNHDQAFISKILNKFLGFSRFDGNESELDRLWRKFVPIYPPKAGKLYMRLDMPSILYTDTVSVAIYVGEGSNLINNLTTKLSDIDYSRDLSAFAIVADADKYTPDQVAKIYHNGFKELFSNFPSEVSEAGSITESFPKLGLYILPDNLNQGVLDSLLCSCGEVVYPEYIKRARAYIEQFSQEEIKQMRWKPFDKEKATIATVVSVFKPGKTNTVSITDNEWVCTQAEEQIPAFQNLTIFLRKLLT